MGERAGIVRRVEELAATLAGIADDWTPDRTLSAAERDALAIAAGIFRDIAAASRAVNA